MKALLLAALTASSIGYLTVPASAAPASGIAIKEAADTQQLAQDAWYGGYRYHRPYYSYYYRPYYYRPYRPFAFYRPFYRPYYGHYGYRRW